MASNSQTNSWAVIALLISSAMWGVLWYPLRLLDNQGMDGLTTSLVMYVAASLVGLPWVKGMLTSWAKQPLTIVAILITSGWTNIAFVLAMLDGNVVRVLLLFYLSPLWAVLLGRVFLGERVGLRGALTLALAMIGAGIMLWHPGAASLWPQSAADWYALTAGMSFAGLNVAVRHGQQIPQAHKANISWWGVVILSVIWILIAGQGLPVIANETYFWAALLGVAGIVVMTLTVQYGVTHMPIQRSAIILLFEIVAGAVSAHFLANESVLLREWIGGGLILLAGYLALQRSESRES